MPSSGWCSKKHDKAGLAHELGIAIFHNKLVWINGPFPAGQNDKKTLTKPDGLKSKIPRRKRAIGDECCVGHPDHITTRNGLDSDKVKMFKKRVKACHETFNSRLKGFGILNQAFRSAGPPRLEKHEAAFEACCVIVQCEVDNGSPLFVV